MEEDSPTASKPGGQLLEALYDQQCVVLRYSSYERNCSIRKQCCGVPELTGIHGPGALERASCGIVDFGSVITEVPIRPSFETAAQQHRPVLQ